MKTPVRSTTSSGSSAARPWSASTSSPTRTGLHPSTNGNRVSTTWPSPAPTGAELEQWESELDELGIPNGGIVDAGYGSGLAMRDPDNIALEFFAPPG